jgi:hypothetical protein
VVLDVGCGVASFGGFLFDKDVLTMSFTPKGEHEAQVQFALERNIPTVSAVMGTKRLPFPATPSTSSTAGRDWPPAAPWISRRRPPGESLRDVLAVGGVWWALECMASGRRSPHE